ncbi:MAG: C40 family peptidase [Firmicutes bacterium]|nr:C40 family peptidase [Bacillota bacterium]
MAYTAAGLAAHARAQLGQIYWYGTFGQAPTSELLEEKRKQYPAYYTQARVANCKTQIGKPGARVFDCAGLVKSYWMMETPTSKPKYLARYDKSASGLKAACGEKGKIAALPEEPGLLVFIDGTHVGVYIGNGRVIEARGFSHGVVETRLKERAWDSWGRLSWLEKESKLCPACGQKI